MQHEVSNRTWGGPSGCLLRKVGLSLWSGAAAIALILGSFGAAAAQIPGALNLSLNASPSVASIGQQVHFEASASPPAVQGGRITSAVLDYGDGDSADFVGPFSAGERMNRSREHRYSTAGTYTAVLTATASDGSSNTATQTITVTGANPGPNPGPIGGLNVELSASPPIDQTGQVVRFRGTASPPSVLGGSITGMTLDFGDGTSADLGGGGAAGERVTRRTDHRYGVAGSYTAVLTATASNGATNSAETFVTIVGGGPQPQPQPPIGGLNVNLTASPQVVQAGQPVTFNATASPPSVLGGSIVSLELSFDDGVTADLGVGGPGEQVTRTTTHLYNEADTYTAILTATASNGATNSALQTITVQGGGPPPPPGPGGNVILQPGWNLSALTGLPGPIGPLYTYQPGDSDYVIVQNLPPGLGYWVYVSSPTPGSTSIGPQIFSKYIPPGQWAILGNSGSTPATVSGASVAYTYNPVSGYTATTVLQPGQGCWVLVNGGGVVTIAGQ